MRHARHGEAAKRRSGEEPRIAGSVGWVTWEGMLIKSFPSIPRKGDRPATELLKAYRRFMASRPRLIWLLIRVLRSVDG